MAQVIISSSQRTIRVPAKKLRALVALVARLRRVRLAEVDLAVVDARRMAAINRRWLRHKGATDVISFDLTEDSRRGLSLQLVVCADVAVRQARTYRTTPQRELMLYVVHGLLHHMGLDDRTARQAARMHASEQRILDRALRSRRK